MSTPIWHFANRSGQQQGPVTASDLRAAFERGELDASTLVWRDGFSQWQPLSQVSGELGIRGTAPPPLPRAMPASPAASTVPAAETRDPLAYVPPPKKRMSRGVLAAILIGVVLVVMAPLSIIAAIAISQYQDYVGKSQFSEAMAIADSLKDPVMQHYTDSGTCPTTADAGVGSLSGRYVARVEMPGGPAPCSFVLIFAEREPVTNALRGGRVTFSNTADGWTCRSGLADKFKPASCRDSGVN